MEDSILIDWSKTDSRFKSLPPLIPHSSEEPADTFRGARVGVEVSSKILLGLMV
jgi:hypothetical protein